MQVDEPVNYRYEMTKYIPIILILLCVVFHRLATLPNLNYLASDPANIASFALGKDFNGYFPGDPVMSSPEMYSWYTPLYVELIRKLSRVFSGNYFWAFWSQIDLSMFLFALGCYVFGRDFLGGRRYGILFLLLNLPFIKAPLGGGWGLPLHQTRPAVLFISVLPLLLWAFWKLRDKKYGSIVACSLAGFSFYIHPVSAPFWILSIWIAGWLSPNGELMLRDRWSRQIKAIGILAMIALPYAVLYTLRYESSVVRSVPYETLMEIAGYRINNLAFRPLEVPLAFWKEYPVHLRVLSIISPVLLGYLLHLKRAKRKANIILIWLLCLLFVGSIIPFVDQTVCSYLRKFPYELDLPRSYIFLPFILYMLFLLFLKCGEEFYQTRKVIRKAIYYGGIIIALAFCGTLYFPASIGPVVKGWMRGETYLRPFTRPNNFTATLLKAASTPRDPVCHFPGGTSALCVRYEAKRPLLYCYKDGGVFLYSDHEKLVKWYRHALAVRRLRKLVSGNYSASVKGNALITWANSLEAKYLLVDKFRGTPFDFGDLRTMQCQEQTLVDLTSYYENERIIKSRTLWNRKGEGAVINLLSFKKLPKWLQKNGKWSDDIVTNTDEKQIYIMGKDFDSVNNLAFQLRTAPGKIYMLSVWIYYETEDPEFNIIISSWKARLHGERSFEDGNPVLSEPEKWKHHEVLIVVPPEIHPDDVKIEWNLISMSGKGKTIIRDATLQYLSDFPMANDVMKYY